MKSNIKYECLKVASEMTRDEYIEYIKEKDIAMKPEFLVFDSQKIDREDFMRLVQAHYREDERFGNHNQLILSITHFTPK